jgi:very-short-patch-repair endonuclease
MHPRNAKKILNTNERLRLTLRIAESLAEKVKAYDLPRECVQLGLADGDPLDAHNSKRNYVRHRIETLDDGALLQVAFDVEEKYPDFGFRELAKKVRDQMSGPDLSDLTRRIIVNELERVELFGDYSRVVDVLEAMWPLSEMSAPYGIGSLKEAIIQHCIRNPEDWDNTYLLDQLDVIGCSRSLFFEFLEAVVHPNARRNAEQQKVVDTINPHLKKDGYHFIQNGSISGYALFRIVPITGGVTGAPKNLIFAADGPKPEIVLSDAINNDIQIVKNAEHCLVYDRPIGTNGLSKLEMIEWWQDHQKLTDDELARKSLVERLSKSLASIGEKNLFYSYYKTFKSRGDQFPALIPQVYLHYDPYTIKQLGGISRLTRQRMDFLILFSSTVRVVIEVDGSQHFSDAGAASLEKYAEMVQADRDLKLAGYEIYRFGANELCGKAAEAKIQDFFHRLAKKHGL